MAAIVRGHFQQLLRAPNLCPSTYPLLSGLVKCERDANHDERVLLHRGITASGLTIHWTAEEAAKEREKLFGPFKRRKPFIGWRAWKLVKGPRLKSVTANVTWDRPVMRTRDGAKPFMRSFDPVTIWDITCGQWDYGVHCYKTPELMVKYLDLDDAFALDARYPILGKVELSGRVVEHEHGYRAEVATIRELFYIEDELHFLAVATGESARQVEELGQFYDCPVTRLSFRKIRTWAAYTTQEQEAQDGSRSRGEGVGG